MKTVSNFSHLKMLIFVWKSLSFVWLFVTPCGLYSPWNSPARILDWVAFPFSRGSSQPRDWTQPRDRTQVFCIAGGFFTSWLSHKGSPSMLEWVAYPFSRGSSWPRNWTRVSCFAGGFFTTWTMIFVYFFPIFFPLAWHKHFCFNFWLLIYFFTRPLLYLALSVILYFLMLISIFNVNFF